jgi:hypothetical protein
VPVRASVVKVIMFGQDIIAIRNLVSPVQANSDVGMAIPANVSPGCERGKKIAPEFTAFKKFDGFNGIYHCGFHRCIGNLRPPCRMLDKKDS